MQSLANTEVPKLLPFQYIRISRIFIVPTPFCNKRPLFSGTNEILGQYCNSKVSSNDSTLLDRKRPWRWLSWLECSTPTHVECSNPRRNRPNLKPLTDGFSKSVENSREGRKRYTNKTKTRPTAKYQRFNHTALLGFRTIFMSFLTIVQLCIVELYWEYLPITWKPMSPQNSDKRKKKITLDNDCTHSSIDKTNANLDIS